MGDAWRDDMALLVAAHVQFNSSLIYGLFFAISTRSALCYGREVVAVVVVGLQIVCVGRGFVSVRLYDAESHRVCKKLYHTFVLLS